MAIGKIRHLALGTLRLNRQFTLTEDIVFSGAGLGHVMLPNHFYMLQGVVTDIEPAVCNAFQDQQRL